MGNKTGNLGSSNDFIFTGLRLIDGINAGDWKAIFGSELFDELCGPLEEMMRGGLLAADPSGRIIRFTPEGLDRTNYVMEALIGALGGRK